MSCDTLHRLHDHLVVIDCQIDSDDKVWPMVAPGAPINEAFDEKDLEAKNVE